MFKVGDEIDCVITEIDKDKRRVAISHRLTQENPFETFEKKYPVGTIVEGEVVNKNEYSLFVKVEDIDVEAFLHCNDLTYSNNGEEELSNYKKGDKIFNVAPTIDPRAFEDLRRLIRQNRGKVGGEEIIAQALQEFKDRFGRNPTDQELEIDMR